MSALRAPFPWFGGKRRVAPEVWERFGDVPNYVSGIVRNWLRELDELTAVVLEEDDDSGA